MSKVCYVVSGPSGAGKSTIIESALRCTPSVGTTVSCTTRSPRIGEKDGVEYHFITHEKFKELVQEGAFVEYVECFKNLYGTLKNSVFDVLKEKDTCIMDLEFEGAYNVLMNKIIPEFECIGIMILPPSMRTLRNRLQQRNSEEEKILQIRLKNSFNCIRVANYKYVIINDNIQRASEEFIQIIEARGLI